MQLRGGWWVRRFGSWCVSSSAVGEFGVWKGCGAGRQSETFAVLSLRVSSPARRDALAFRKLQKRNGAWFPAFCANGISSSVRSGAIWCVIEWWCKTRIGKNAQRCGAVRAEASNIGVVIRHHQSCPLYPLLGNCWVLTLSVPCLCQFIHRWWFRIDITGQWDVLTFSKDRDIWMLFRSTLLTIAITLSFLC